jgi:uncharacterized protein with FMN-binding domain
MPLMRKVAGALLATVAGLIALLSFKSHTPAAASALTSVGNTGGGSALSGAGAPTSAPAAPSTGTSPSAGTGAGTTKSPSSGSGAIIGTFTGSSVDTPYGPVQVSATLSGGKLTDVNVLQVPDNGRYEDQIVTDAVPMLKSEALSAQSANIDIVSGATFTSQGYAQSLQSALNQAGLK